MDTNSVEKMSLQNGVRNLTITVMIMLLNGRTVLKEMLLRTFLGIKLPLNIYDGKTGESHFIEDYTELKRFFDLLPGYKIFK